jgi:hypothetical protein
MPSQMQKPFAKETSISELSDARGKYSVLGTISAKDASALSAKLSDKGKSVALSFPDEETFDSVAEKDFVRAAGKTLYNNNILTLNIETIHIIQDFDPELYEKVRNFERKLKL